MSFDECRPLKIEHDPKEGAVALAKKLLDTIVEVPRDDHGYINTDKGKGNV